MTHNDVKSKKEDALILVKAVMVKDEPHPIK